jgi:hypothetical protein
MTTTHTPLDEVEAHPIAATGSIELADGSRISMTALRGVQAIGLSGPLNASDPGDLVITVTSADGGQKSAVIPDDLQYPFLLMVRSMTNATTSRDRSADQPRRDNA